MTIRPLFEAACRTVAVVSLGAAAWMSWRGTAANDGAGARAGRTVVSFDGASLRDTSGSRAMDTLRAVLVRAATTGDSVEVRLPQVPAVTVRAAIAAAPRVRWVDSSGASGVALSVAAAPGPSPAVDIRAATGTSGMLVLRDAGGLIDSVSGAPHAARGWRVRSRVRELRADAAGAVASAAPLDSAPAKRLFVYGEPGWESKFVVAALEELGWGVDGTFRISPAGRVVIGAPARLDTSRYAVALVLDSTAVDARALAAFAAAGGGVVLGGDALRLPSLAALRPATASELRGGIAGALLTEAPRRGLDAWELTPVRGATVLQEDRGDHAHAEPAVVARRVGAGRVVATAYRESWRWRMQGTDDGVSEHRQWWGDVLSAALPQGAGVAAPGGAERWPGDAAPYADLVARAGPPVAAWPATTVRAGADVPWRWAPWMFVIAMLSLLAEWASRRLRGER